jgi:hypothetical protein
MTFSIPEENLPQLQEILAKLNKRAAKLKVEPIVIEFLGTHIKRRDLGNGNSYDVLYHDIAIEGVTPKLAGWSFVATLNHIVGDDGETLTLIKAIPDVEIPATFRDAEPVCNHCGFKRKRIDTFILRNEDGTFKQVGRNCLVDFLGGADPKVVAAQLEMLIDLVSAINEFDDRYDMGGTFSRDRSFNLREYLLYVASSIRAYGWVSRKTAREVGGEASSTTAFDIWFAKDGAKQAKFKRDGAYPTDVDAKMVDDAMSWAETTLHSQDSGALNDYQYNLKVATSSSRIDFRFTGIVASLIYAYTIDLGRREERANLMGSKFVGEVGKRQVFAVKVINARPYVSDFGSGTIVKATTADGDVIMWFGSGQYALGADLIVKGTVKKHNDYKGVKETQLNRVTELTPEQAQEYAAKAARKAAREAKKAAKATVVSTQTPEVA